jgi:hypothetical protein
MNESGVALRNGFFFLRSVFYRSFLAYILFIALSPVVNRFCQGTPCTPGSIDAILSAVPSSSRCLTHLLPDLWAGQQAAIASSPSRSGEHGHTHCRQPDGISRPFQRCSHMPVTNVATGTRFPDSQQSQRYMSAV